MTYLIDTNAVIALLAGDQGITAKVNAIEQYEKLQVSTTTLGELYFGAQKSAKLAENIRTVDTVSQRAVVVSCDLDTARVYGLAKHKLRSKGRPIPDNDIWIASTALQYSLILLTNDRHFSEVDGLSVEGW